MDHGRLLNAYESMLSTATVTVGVDLGGEVGEVRLSRAWSRVVKAYDLTRARIIPDKDNPMLMYAHVDDAHIPLLRFGELNPKHTIERAVINCGNELPPDDAAVAARILRVPATGNLRFVLTLSHSVSDGPGAWALLNSMLEQLAEDAPPPAHEPLTDCQAMLLKDEPPAKGTLTASYDISDNARALWLPIESAQQIPSGELAANNPGRIESVHRTIELEEVSALRKACRRHNASIQGALTAAAIVVRLALVDYELPTRVPTLIPVNSRPTTMSKLSCVCGSAGVWMTLDVEPDASMLAFAATVTKRLREAIDARAHVDWLRTLIQNPGELPPHALITTSIGQVPLRATYGNVQVKHVAFFAGRQKSIATRDAVGTMVHWSTTEVASHLAFNYTSPGVAHAFAVRTADAVVDLLRRIAVDDMQIIEAIRSINK